MSCFRLTTTGKGYCSVIGAMMINIVIGAFYLWGTLNLYIASYFKILDPTFTLERSLIVFPLMTIAFHSCAPFGMILCEKIGFRFYMFLCLLVFCCSHFFALSVSNFWGFFFIFGFLSGASGGFAYLVPLYNAYKYFPLRRGLISGLILGAYGFGSMISSPILMAFLNPDNVTPVEDPSDQNYYFTKEICGNITYSLRILSAVFLLLGLLGISLCIEYEENQEFDAYMDDINNPKENTKALVLELIENEDWRSEKSPIILESPNNSKLSHVAKISQFSHKRNNSVFNSKIGIWPQETINPVDETRCKSLSEASKSNLFWLLLVLFTFSASGGLFLAANYKNLGIISIPDDNFLNAVGSVGAIANGGGRVIWGLLMDRFHFQKSFFILLSLELIEGFLLRFLLGVKWVYLLLVGTGFLCLGGHMVLFPTFCIKSFGPKIGAEAYGIILFGFCFANLIQAGLVMGLKSVVGFENLRFLFLVGTGLCLVILKWGKLSF